MKEQIDHWIKSLENEISRFQLKKTKESEEILKTLKESLKMAHEARRIYDRNTRRFLPEKIR